VKYTKLGLKQALELGVPAQATQRIRIDSVAINNPIHET